MTDDQVELEVDGYVLDEDRTAPIGRVRAARINGPQSRIGRIHAYAVGLPLLGS